MAPRPSERRGLYRADLLINRLHGRPQELFLDLDRRGSR